MLPRLAILSAALLLTSCATCGDFREDTVRGPQTQLVHYCFVSHADLAAAVVSGKLDVSKLSAPPVVCLKSSAPIPVGSTCP